MLLILVSTELRIVLILFRYEWYQTETHVVISILVKNTKKEDLKYDIQETTVNCLLLRIRSCIVLKFVILSIFCNCVLYISALFSLALPLALMLTM